MKISVVGCGQCGGKVADAFNQLNNEALFYRRLEVITDVIAVNTDVADLDSLTSIKKDAGHRILIGSRKTGSHGVGKINEVGAELALRDGDKVIDAIRSSKHFHEADAFLFIAGVAGGTGSGSMPVIADIVKKRFKNKPIYALVVLPFEHEEKTDARTVYNSATCLKATDSVADAVFLVDNQRFIEKDSSLVNNMAAINRMIAAPFYDVLRAGEEKKSKHIGVRLLDAGDIIQTLGGWTVLGYGKSPLQRISLPFDWRRGYRKTSAETNRGLHAMDEAISNLSLQCSPEDSTSALYLLSAPAKEMSMNLVKELGEYMSEIAPKAIIRYGDYPSGGSELKITVVLSRLNRVSKVKDYYESMPDIVRDHQTRQRENDSRLKELVNASAVVPSLFGGNGD
ncbi:MAG: cell division protein FtsZ [Chloroflexi bacterium]|nr:cell division protein FtsZ [Chloroflexota bacterium]